MSTVIEPVEIDYINPVVLGLEEVFSTMLDCKIERTGLDLMEGDHALYPVSGIIGLSGKGVGTVVLSMEKPVAMKATEVMLMIEGITEISNDVLDAVGEITNMICGHAKSKLPQFQLSISLPNVLCAEKCWLHFPQTAPPIVIPFRCPWGLVALQIGFALPAANRSNH
jgi:chemotaxis protein CheX